MGETNMFRHRWAALALGAVSLGIAHAEGGAPENLRFGWQAATPTSTFYVAYATQAFENEGFKLKLESFNDNTPELEALVARQVDLAAVAPAPTVQAISFGAPLKIISAVEYGFTDKQGHKWSAVNFVARKDSGIKTIGDLKGKRVAVFGLSSNWYLAFRDRLREAGMDPKDITFLSMPYPQMEGALVHNEVDAAIMTSIGAYHTAERIPLNNVMSADEITGIALDMSQVIVARADWLKDHEDEAVRFLMAMLKTRLAIQQDVEQNNGAKIKKITAEALKYDEPTNEAFYQLRVSSAGHELDFINSLDLPRQTFVAYGEMLTSAGMLRGRPAASFEQIADTSYLKKAYQQLGWTWDDSKLGKPTAGQ
jgi:ABC-type nitrate/sulfonate/bicarbonate transport system substrate-binding protein